ncbi:hypothetical protein B0T10DRAFT_543067 [Thelonectria olida]|uniref:Uncharacterized protein n=1 Tax=Thelonectria olida TaxID=1576542 RepID=A0A9P8WF96_9HYPO|nr:hypothetical protein B0T10DRAFT_543067 [Thelonectria olida]
MAELSQRSVDPRYELVHTDESTLHDPLNKHAATHNITPGFESDSSGRRRGTLSLFRWRIAALLRKARLQGVLIAFQSTREWVHRVQETPIVKDRLAATLTAMIHLPAVAGVITLSFYIWKNYYIGKELQGAPNHDIEKKLGIQFAAKLMELFITLSLSSILFAMVRHEFTIGEGVPYGALVAGQQITEISFLWSTEFFTIVTGKFSRIWKKLAFITVAFLFTILAFGASSLSATVMMPQEGDWAAGGSLIWANATPAEIFPGILTENNTVGSVCNTTGDNRCPSWEWEVLNQQLISKLSTSSQVVDGLLGPRPPRNIVLSGLKTLVKMTVDVRETWRNNNSPNHTVASMPHFVPSDACVLSSLHWEEASVLASETGKHRYSYYTKIEHQLNAPMPITFTKCQRSSMDSDDIQAPSFPDFRSFDYPAVSVTNDDIASWMNETLPDLESPEVMWFNLDSAWSGNASVGVVVAVPTNSSSKSVDVYGCMIDARFVGATITGDAVALMSQGVPAFSDALATSLAGSWIRSPTYGSRVYLQPSFAQYLNPLDSKANRTIVHEMILTSGVWTSDGKGSRSARHVEAILAVLATNGLGRSAPNVSAITKLSDPQAKDWWKKFMPQNGKVFGPGGSPYAVSSEDKARLYGMEMQTWITGYAFADNSLTMRAAMAVFYVYVLVVVVFSIWSIWSGITSSSWESVPELLSLSLADQASAEKSGMRDPEESAPMDFMKENYCIAAEGSKLRLRTTHGTVPFENRIKPNKSYD